MIGSAQKVFGIPTLLFRPCCALAGRLSRMEKAKMKHKMRDLLLLIAACLTLAWSIPSVGQVLKGSISGTVADPQGAVVSGAQVKVTNTATGNVLTTTSDSSGLFRFNLIVAGDYKIEVSAPHFTTAVQSNILVAASRESSLGTIKLTVGEASTTVEVTATAPLIEPNQAQVTNTFSGATLSTFAGVQENQGLDRLALFVPGVVSVRDNGFSNSNGGMGFSSNGLRGRNNDQQIDGQNNNDNSVAGPVVNIVTKSGTNAWHGSIYGNENNSVLNSMSNFQKNYDSDVAGNPLTKPPRLNDEFAGFTIGGPWIKNKVFFFGGFNQENISTKSIFHSDSLTPTPTGLRQLNACFPASQSMAAFNKIGPYAISGGSPFPTDPTPLTGPGSVTVAGCPAGVEFGGVTRVLQTPVHIFDFTNRMDWQLGSDAIMGRYLFNRTNFFNTDAGDGAAGYPVNVPALSQSVLIGDTHNFTPRMVNELRVGFGRTNVQFGGNSLGTVPTANNVDQAISKITFNQAGTNFLSIGAATNLPQSRIVNTWQATDNWNYALGKHTLKAGVNWTYQRTLNIFLPLLDGSFRYGSWGSFAITNTPNRVQLADGNPNLDFREQDTFLYFGDDWKIGHNLTLNLGLTWSYYGQPANLFNQIATPREANPATALWASTSSVATTAGSAVIGQAIPLSARTFPTFPAPKNSFGPSVGFAYSPQWGGFLTGNGKTVIRGGYRLLYDPPFYNIYINMSSSAPEVFLQSFTGAASRSKPLPTTANGPTVRSTYNSFLTPGIFDPRQFANTTMSPDFRRDTVHSYSFGVERELTKNSAVEVRYAGNRGQDLFQSVNGNPDVAGLQAAFPNLVPAGFTPCPAANAVVSAAIGRANCNLGITRTRNNGGYSGYDGLQTEFRANNLFKQLTIRSAFTWSKTLDNVSEIFSTGAGANSTAWAQNPFNTTTAEHSFSGLDIPHQWTILFSEELPFFKEQRGMVGHLLGGWT